MVSRIKVLRYDQGELVLKEIKEQRRKEMSQGPQGIKDTGTQGDIGQKGEIG